MRAKNIFLVVVLVLAGCASSPELSKEDKVLAIERLAQDVNDELVVGRQMAAKLLGHFGTIDPSDEAMVRAEQYVQLVGGTLARRIGRPELKFHFGLLNDADPNAYAAPAGYIFLTTGLLKAVRDESELAGVLAHEIAHVNERHMADAILPKRDPTAGTVVVSFLSRGRSTLGVSLSSVVNRGMELLLEKGMSEPLETEADRAAISYTAACGYNPVGLLTLMERVSGSPSAKSSKPSPHRLARLKSHVAAEGVVSRALGDEKVMRSRFDVAMAPVHP